MSAKNRKLQVFVSSTFEDLKEERQAAVQAILNAGHIPAGMELFAAGDKSQMQVIRDWIQESDVFMLILGGRYGSIEPESDQSYIQLEYEYATKNDIPHFAVVISERGLDLKVEKQGKGVLELAHSEKYNEFKKLVTASKMVKFWDNTSEIELAVFKSLAEFNKREELVGWVRGNETANNALLAEEMARLGKENAELREEVKRLHTSDDFGGITFESLYQILEKKKYSPEFLISQIPFEREKKAISNIVDKLKISEISVNDLIIAFSRSINGIVVSSGYRKSILDDILQENGLIKFFQNSYLETISEFTEQGRKYFFKLRSLEKYKDWNDEDQIQ